jgi:hypothetical protein
MRSRPAVSGCDPGAAGGSFEGQQVRQPISGPGRPRKYGSAGRRAQVRVDLAGDVPFQAADDLCLRQAFFAAPVNVGAGGRVRAHPGDHYSPQGMVSLPVAAGVEPVADGLARGGGDRGGGAQVRPGGLRAQPCGMVARRDEQ